MVRKNSFVSSSLGSIIREERVGGSHLRERRSRWVTLEREGVGGSHLRKRRSRWVTLEKEKVGGSHLRERE